MAPAAPGLFSTTMGCFHSAPSVGCMMRASASVPPAGGNGTMTVTGLEGNVSACAKHAKATARMARKDGSWRDDGGLQGGHAFDGALDDVTGLEIEVLRIGLARG